MSMGQWECVPKWLWICVVKNKICDNTVYIIHTCTHAQAYMWDVARESLSCDMMPKYGVIYEISWLIATPRCWFARVWVTGWTRSVLVRRQVWQCHGNELLTKRNQPVESSFVDWLERQDFGLLEFGWHDERGQH